MPNRDKYNRVTVARDYKITFDLCVVYETTEEGSLPSSLGEYLDDKLDVLSLLSEHLVMDPRSAIREIRNGVISAELAGLGIDNVSDITGE